MTDQENDIEAIALAEKFHDLYEKLAPSFDYETRKETKKFHPDTRNGRLMTAVCKEILKEHKGAIQRARKEAYQKGSTYERRVCAEVARRFCERYESPGSGKAISDLLSFDQASPPKILSSLECSACLIAFTPNQEQRQRWRGGKTCYCPRCWKGQIKPHRHEWRLEGPPGLYDTIYRCKKCKKRLSVSIDIASTALPIAGCDIE